MCGFPDLLWRWFRFSDWKVWGKKVLQTSSGKDDLLNIVLNWIFQGGMKIWECCLDLVQYLHEEKFNFSGKRVLELGCGAGKWQDWS